MSRPSDCQAPGTNFDRPERHLPDADRIPGESAHSSGVCEAGRTSPVGAQSFRTPCRLTRIAPDDLNPPSAHRCAVPRDVQRDHRHRGRNGEVHEPELARRAGRVGVLARNYGARARVRGDPTGLVSPCVRDAAPMAAVRPRCDAVRHHLHAVHGAREHAARRRDRHLVRRPVVHHPSRSAAARRTGGGASHRGGGGRGSRESSS